MNRADRILKLAAKTKADEDTLAYLDIPKYEITRGLNKDEIKILLLNSNKLFSDNNIEENLAQTPECENQTIQIVDISSTSKDYNTRRLQETSRNLFKELQECKHLTNNLVTSSASCVLNNYSEVSSSNDSDRQVDSGDEYIPETEPETSDDESDCTVKEVLNNKNNEIQALSDNNENLNLDDNSKILKKINKRVWNKKDYCYFCDTEVIKFSRHVLRHHENEFEVQEILSIKTGDKKRKLLFNKLRKKGNFVKSTFCENIVPVRNPVLGNLQPTVASYLPCKYCRGFYQRKSLFRHVKICPFNNEKYRKVNAQSEGQSLFSSYKNNDILRKYIFSTMRADAVSFAAKTDPLICAVGNRYLKSHRDKHFRTVASRKMRQLGLLLIEMKKHLKIKSLYEALDPLNFELIVKSTKIISKYNAETDSYGAPSLALHMGTELKDCIDVAYNMSLKKFNGENEKSKKLKILKELITNEWRYEVSTLANSDLEQKKWNKPSLIPLAEDLALLRTYLLAEGEKYRNILKSSLNDEKAFKTLIEISYVQLILLNRRRVGELQRMTISSYIDNINKASSSEFDSCISESEKILMKSFKRVVIRGKRGRGVPVLFTDDIMKNISLVLGVRENFLQQENVYLFPNIMSSNSINGSKAVYKHVRLAGVKNPGAITSTKLRKHLATMSQVINLNAQDLEQLASFMGHTSEIHKTYYRLPSDIYQMAKVSKLLLLNEKGEASKYQGKTLDEIDIDLAEPVEDNSDDDNSNNLFGQTNQQGKSDRVMDKMEEKLAHTNVVNPPQKQKKRLLEAWTKQQKETALSFFKNHIKNKKPPKKDECLRIQENNPGLFHNKSWEKIKIYIVNTYKKN